MRSNQRPLVRHAETLKRVDLVGHGARCGSGDFGKRRERLTVDVRTRDGEGDRRRREAGGFGSRE
jgi:hypothetical protein